MFYFYNAFFFFFKEVQFTIIWRKWSLYQAVTGPCCGVKRTETEIYVTKFSICLNLSVVEKLKE